MTNYKYSWSTANWDTLPESLANLEREGWEIFTVCPLSGSQFCKIVYRCKIEAATPKTEVDDGIIASLIVQTLWNNLLVSDPKLTAIRKSGVLDSIFTRDLESCAQTIVEVMRNEGIIPPKVDGK